MPNISGIRRALRVHFGTRGVRRAIDDEIAFHLDTRVRDLRRRGMSEADARETALREFGDLTAARHDLETIDRRASGRRARVEAWSDLRRDVVVGIRSLRRQPALTAASLITLALGIGANAAIFTVMQAALLEPLPYERPERLVHLWQTRAEGTERTASSFPDFVDLRAGVRALTAIEGYDPTNVTVGGDDSPTMIQGGRVTAGFFAALGVRPALGRLFLDGEDKPGAPQIVMLSDGFWRSRFGGNRAVIGRSLAIDGLAYEIIGILPPGFHFAPIGTADVWLPIDRSEQTRAARSSRWLNLIARLRDGSTIDGVQHELAASMRRLAESYPETNAGRSATAVALRDEVVGDVRPLLLVLTGAVVLVLLIACANVAGLLLARTLARSRELAVRTALGASRWRLVRQVLTESVILSLAGGALAAWLASAGARLLISAIPEGMRSGMPFWAEGAGPGVRTAMYSVALALTAGVVFGLIPALSASRTSLGSLGDVLRQGGRGVAGSRSRLRDALVAGQIALTIVLLAGTGLLVRSFDRLMHVDPGFDAGPVVTARVALAGPRYATNESRRRFFADALDRVRAVPGVEAVGAVSSLPLNGGGTNRFLVVGAPEPPPSQRHGAVPRVVAGDYFDAMRIRLVEGRGFTSRDDTTAAPVVVMNVSLARQLFGTGSAVGARLRFYAFPEQEWEVIGVVGDVKTLRLDEAVAPTIYYSQAQTPQNRMSLSIRVACAAFPRGRPACSPAAIIGAVRKALAASDPGVPVYAAGTMEQQVLDSPAVFARRYPLLLIGLFAATALVLAVVGLYGVISYAVTQRTREFGVRMALGAPAGAIRNAVLRRGALVAGVGVAVGVPGALVLTRAMRGMLYGVGPTDPLTYLGACVVLVSVTVVASWIPAYRATRIRPAIALRTD